jgi:hypothetical protein
MARVQGKIGQRKLINNLTLVAMCLSSDIASSGCWKNRSHPRGILRFAEKRPSLEGAMEHAVAIGSWSENNELSNIGILKIDRYRIDSNEYCFRVPTIS